MRSAIASGGAEIARHAERRSSRLVCPWQPEPLARDQLDKGETMPTIFGHHDVKDAKHYLAQT